MNLLINLLHAYSSVWRLIRSALRQPQSLHFGYQQNRNSLTTADVNYVAAVAWQHISLTAKVEVQGKKRRSIS